MLVVVRVFFKLSLDGNYLQVRCDYVVSSYYA